MNSQRDLLEPRWLTTISVFSLLAFFFYRRWMRGKISNVHRLPGPDGAHWLWGHDKIVVSRSVDDQHSDWLNQYGETISVTGAFWVGKTVVTADPNVISHVFTKNQRNYRKAFHLRQLYKRITGDSLVSAEGAEHKRMKAAIAPAFTSERIRGMEDVVLNSIQKLVSTLNAHLRERRKITGVEDKALLVNALDWTNKAGLDIIGGVGWGWNFHGGDSALSMEVHHAWRNWTNQGTNFSNFLMFLLLRAFPVLNVIPLPINAVRSQSDIRNRVAKIVHPVAVERVSQLQASNKPIGSEKDVHSDILSFLIRASVTAGNKVDIDELVEHMVQMVMVGSETAASTLAYILYSLSRNPDVQAKLRTELEEFDREPTYDDLHNPKVLTYLDAVMKEGFRMFSVLGHTERTAVADDVIPLKYPVVGKDGKTITELRVHAGQNILFPLVSINTHSRTWGPNGGDFKPSRWLDHPESAPKAMPGGYQHLSIFGEGPRQCTGMRLAIFEIKALLVALVRNFKIENSGLEIVSKFVSVMQPFVVEPEKGTEGTFMPIKLEPVTQE